MAPTLSFLWRRRKRLRHKKDKVEHSETAAGLFGRHVG
jgi:hypothetical protein